MTARQSELVPRLYQQEMLVRAEERNTIIRLDTGTGKSLIAIMLMRIMSSKLASDPGAPNKLIVFIVPTRELVTQQENFINSQLQLVVKGLRGDDQVDFWDYKRWKAELQGVHVLVCTAQIFYNMLCHAYVSIENVSLLIFDECHHASKSHPYAQIMHQGYHRYLEANPGKKHMLPRILGLTASPIHNARNPVKGIQDLEAILDSTVAEVQDHTAELLALSRLPTERIEYYPSPPLLCEEESTFREMLRESPADRFFLEDEKANNQLQVVTQELGSLAADIFVLNWLAHFLVSSVSGQSDVMSANLDEISNMQSLVDRFEKLLKKRDVSDNNCTPKVINLLQILVTYNGTSNFMGLVFVQMRATCAMLARIITMSPELAWIACDHLVGHGDIRDGSTSLASKQQAKVVQRFRKGELNLLVCTQVAEEGLDFPACRCVIRFDAPLSLISYIQSRGRARALDSELVVMAEKGSMAEIRFKQFAIDEESLKPLYNLDHEANEHGESQVVRDGQQFPVFEIPSGAMLTYFSAVPLLHEFCSLLPRDEYTPLPKPIFSVYNFNDRFQSTLVLPINIHLSAEQRCFLGPLMPTKMEAKQAVAFEAVQTLYDAEAFNEHLLPIREEYAAAAIDAHGDVIDITKVDEEVESVHHNQLGNLYDLSGELFLHNIVFRSESRHEQFVGLIAGKYLDLDDEPCTLYDESPAGILQFKIIEVIPLEWDLDERAEKIKQIIDFNHKVLQIACNRRYLRKYADVRLYQLLVPLIGKQTTINWDLILKPFGETPSSDTPRGQLLVAPEVHRLRHARLFSLERYRPDIKLSSAIDEKLLLDKNPRVLKTYGAFFRDEEKGYKLDYLWEDEPLLEVIPPMFPVSYLQPINHDMLRRRHNGIVPQTICRASRLDFEFWRIARMLPSWTRMIVDRVRVTQTMRELQLPPIRADLVLQALTLPACNVGYDYETLETVGDCFLKLATSVQIFNRWPAQQEGFMTQIRVNSIDNQFLRKHALNLGLPSYFISDHYKAAEVWTPPQMDCDPVDGGLYLRRMVPRRTLSDVMEALLGAAVATAGIEMGLAVGTKLQMCFGGSELWAARYIVQESRSTTLPPNLAVLEKTLGYNFRNNRLLLEALMHRSCPSASLASRSYERLEFLGDAVIDFFVVFRAYREKPNIKPYHLSNFKQTLVSNGSLAYIALTKLQLHKCILHGSNALTAAHNRAEGDIPSFGNRPYYESVFLWDPPKTLADCLEAIIGAIFVDSNYNMETVDEVLTWLMEDLFVQVPFDCPDDPISQLKHFQQLRFCSQMVSKADRRHAEQLCTWSVKLHGLQIGTAASASRYVAQQAASLEAVEWLKRQSPEELNEQCPCKIQQQERQARLNLQKAEAKLAAKFPRMDMDDKGERSNSSEPMTPVLDY